MYFIIINIRTYVCICVPMCLMIFLCLMIYQPSWTIEHQAILAEDSNDTIFTIAGR